MIEKIENARAKLRESYDSFTKLYGQLNKSRNKRLLIKDDKYFEIASTLEVRENTTYRAADILYKSNYQEQVPFTTENPIEALGYSLGMYGKVDINFIVDATGIEEPDLLQDLKELIYWNPIVNHWCTSDEFLSGDVYSKIEQIKSILNKLENEI